VVLWEGDQEKTWGNSRRDKTRHWEKGNKSEIRKCSYRRKGKKMRGGEKKNLSSWKKRSPLGKKRG